jgi:hypothetical protein
VQRLAQGNNAVNAVIAVIAANENPTLPGGHRVLAFHQSLPTFHHSVFTNHQSLITSHLSPSCPFDT